jgi:AraC-like DNA-binding protein
MGMQFLNTLILLGALQGFTVTGLLLFFSHTRSKANNYLAALIFLFSFASLGVYLMNIGIKYTSPFWMAVSMVVPFFTILPIGPLIYFYTRSLTGVEIRTRQNWHFAPVIIDLIPQLASIVFLTGWLAANGFSKAVHDTFVDEYQAYADIPRWISVTTYLVWSWKFLRQQPGSPEVKWLKQFTTVFLAFQAVWFAHLIPYIIPELRNGWIDLVGWYPIYIPLAILIYWLGIKGYFLSRSRPKPRQILENSLSQNVIEETQGALYRSMENERLFLDPTLNLNKMVDHLKIPQKTISAVLNQRLHKSFNEFVNDYRLMEFKKRIGNKAFKHMTILGIAMECGFNSQATFQRAFKQSMGISPTEYLSKVSHEKIHV